MFQKIGSIVTLFVILTRLTALAQEAKSLQIILPHQLDRQNANWNVVAEGQSIDVQIRVAGSKTDSVTYAIKQGQMEGMTLDSTGHFRWTPGFDIADRINTTKSVPLIFEIRNKQGETATQSVDIKVQHVNRPPIIGDLRPFYVRNKTQNVYKIDAAAVRDEDNDPVVFIPIADQMPENSKLTAQGEFTWQLSLNQFNHLRANKGQYIEFWVEDQPAKSRTKGRLKVEVTQMDVPPEITLIPEEPRVKIKENATVNLKFYLGDPNGDDDITTFDFLSESQDVPKSALRKNTETNYEFIWKPGYDFVKDPYDSLTFQIVFFALDKGQNRAERKINFTIYNAVNEDEKDRYYYAQYRQALVTAWNLLEQLGEKEEELKRSYRRAKKGKRNRSVANASLGAVTGVTPAVIANNKSTTVQTNLRYVSAVGGTAVLTMGTLEATEVIGKSMKDLLDRFNYVMSKKSELQNKGDVFAREFALKATRRNQDFVRKLDDFRAALSLSGLVALELDAAWKSKSEASDKALKQMFKDFTPLEEKQTSSRQ
ncbi:hypothetical protein [Larkinella humicola]|uniref:Cadherin domain-containing protein n=1 Tax=Larkinella humicola TaxID=2607654 RepID=A0A5N1JEK9_9BACT|nr:hypothetical protein [Larkinella humicola]KAA9353555.1 hypothetical protein F0P93_12995 [Larkinella humicola]